MHKWFAVLLAAAFSVCGRAQSNYGLEHNLYVYRGQQNRVVPCAYVQGQKGWYGQLRYNYDEAGTLAFFAGRSYAKKGRWKGNLRPQLGLLAGRFTGGGATVEAEFESGAFAASVRPEICLPFNKAAAAFYYNWAEASLQPLPFLYGGLAMQHTASVGEAPLYEPGVFMGLQIGRVDLPVYFFSPGKAAGYAVVSLCWKLKD